MVNAAGLSFLVWWAVTALDSLLIAVVLLVLLLLTLFIATLIDTLFTRTKKHPPSSYDPSLD